MYEILVVTPVYNDWQSFAILTAELNKIAVREDLRIQIIAVDDGSFQHPPLEVGLPPLTNIKPIYLLHLARNLGHQRAIAMGLAAANKLKTGLPIIVMDCDGEDRPEDILELLAEHRREPDRIVFAHRTKRSEGNVFTFFYFFFKLFFRILTGNPISFGNFCLIPPESLGRVIFLQEIWNHFAAGVMHSSLAWKTIPTRRGKRYAGNTQMNMVTLVLHGLSAISVYIEVVYVRLIFLALGVMLLDGVGFLILVYIKYFTPLAIPGWATNVAIGLVVVMSQVLLFLGLLSFVVLSYRSGKMFIPAVDFKDYLLKIEEWPR